MTEEAVCVGVDVAKSTLDVAVSNSKETRQFENDHEGITDAVRYIADVKPTLLTILNAMIRTNTGWQEAVMETK